MARCNCAGSSCSCLVKSGPGLTVKGVGTNADPYIVGLAVQSGPYVHTATGALNLTAAGAYNVMQITLSASVTLVQLPADGQRLDLVFVQDATGGRTVTWTSAGVSWAGGTAPVITATANAKDWISLVHVGSLWIGVREVANAL